MAHETLLTIIGTVFEALVIFFLFYRKIYRVLPVFTTYLVLTAIADTATLYIQGHSTSAASFLHYYLTEMTVDSVLQFAVLVELAWSVLRPVRASLPSSALYVLAIGMAVAGVLIWPLAGKTVSPNASHEISLIIHSQSTFAILRVVCFLLLASFSQILSIGWRDRELQVATGFGFYSIISLIVAVIHSHQPDQGPTYYWLDFAVSASYLGTLSYWVLSFASKEQERKEFSPQMQQFLLQMSGGVRAGRISLADLTSQRPPKKD